MQDYLIKTKHLGMRLIRKDDIDYLKSIDKDPEVKEFFPEGTLSNDQIKSYIAECIYSCKYEHLHLPCLVIFKLKDDKFVGEAYFDQLETGEIKVGYLFHREQWNKGYGTEVLQALLNWAKDNIDTDHIIAYADKNNRASFRVMEKSGMKHYKDAHYLGMDCRFYKIKLH